MRYTDVYDKQSSLELKIYFDTDETPGNVSVQAGAEIIINQQLSWTEERLEMFITRESDYAMRVVRALMGETRLSVSEICEREAITAPFAYKILKKLQNAGIVKDIAEFMADMPWKEILRIWHYMIYIVRLIPTCRLLSAWMENVNVQETARTVCHVMLMMNWKKFRDSCGRCSGGNPWKIFLKKRSSKLPWQVKISVW